MKWSVVQIFNTLNRVPVLGPWLFGRIIWAMTPYTATVRPKVTLLDNGRCRAHFIERFAVRNPFKSIHAAALINFGELVSGFAVVSLLDRQPEWQGIVKTLGAEYHAKARGRISGECRLPATLEELFGASGSAETAGPREVTIPVDLVDERGTKVATVTARWVFRQRNAGHAKAA